MGILPISVIHSDIVNLAWHVLVFLGDNDSCFVKLTVYIFWSEGSLKNVIIVGLSELLSSLLSIHDS